MCADEANNNFDETIRSIAQEVSRTVQRAVRSVDVEEIAGTIGVDPQRAQDWVDMAGIWLRTQTERLGEDLAGRAWPEGANAPAARTEPAAPTEPADDDPLRRAAPHPLDLPTEEQGRALAALDSGRWTVEPGTNALAAHGDGPGPSDALGLVRELRARDWLAVEGGLTQAGHSALRRWLEATSTR